MQVEIETIKPKVYEPKTLKITFETKEEEDLFIEMIGYDFSIPKLVYSNDSEQQTKLRRMMLKIQETLTKDM